MDHEALAALGDTNMANEWAALGRHAGFDLGSTESMTLMASGLPIAFFNGGYAHATPGDPQRCIAEAIEFFARAGVPFLLWLRAGRYDDLVSAGLAARASPVGGPPPMGPPEIRR